MLPVHTYETFSHTEYHYDEASGDYYEEDIYYTDSYDYMIVTDPNLPDTDNDKLPDGYEYQNGLDPTNSSDGTTDEDNDGLTRGEEYEAGTNYQIPDSDFDGYWDGEELLVLGTDPMDENSPGDGSDTPDDNTGGTGGDNTGGTGGGDTPVVDDDPYSQPGQLNRGDQDNDGIPDGWEFVNFGGKYRFSATDNPDNDGLDNAGEFAAGTDPLNSDSDDDGISDGDEVLVYLTDPNQKDSDEDRYDDLWEINNGLNPNDGDDIQLDANSDGVPDAYAAFHSSQGNPVAAGDDVDGDGLTVGIASSSGNSSVSDQGYADGYADGENGNSADPYSRYFGDYYDDGSNYDPDFEAAYADYEPAYYAGHDDGWNAGSASGNNTGGSSAPAIESTSEFANFTYPDNPDSDGDGRTDLEEITPYLFQDGQADGGMDENGDPVIIDDIWVVTDPRNSDTDYDGFDDGVEVAAGTNPTDPWDYPEVDYSSDFDEDGLSDYFEGIYGTEIDEPDSDDDGFTDFEEIFYYGTDPNDELDFWVDSDGDGISDADEVLYFGTDPNLADSDQDGIDDATEIYYDQTDPLDQTHFWVDADDDGLRDDTEESLGLVIGDFDTDGDGLSDLWEFLNGTDPNVADVEDFDEDEILDVWEIAMYLDPTDPFDAFEDPDEDNLNNKEEFLHQTDPYRKDTDGDWLQDDLEVRIYMTDPLDWDTDGDGSADGLELFWYGTNPLDPNDVVVDADEDWIDDDWETANGLDPTDGEDGFADDDGDGLFNSYEYWYGGDPQLADTDGNGINDLEQWESGEAISTGRESFSTSGVGNDFDGDGISDAWEATLGLDVFDSSDAGGDADEDGLNDLEELILGTNPLEPDTDSDGIDDFEELNTEVEVTVTDPDTGVDTVEIHFTDPLDSDSDNDLIEDGDEILLALNPMDPSDGTDDPDDDALTNGEEHLIGTLWLVADTDEDNMTDGWEVANGFNPLVPNDQDEDSDGDGVKDLHEFLLGTNPKLKDNPVVNGNAGAGGAAIDTDGDGINDDDEIKQGSDPDDPNSTEPQTEMCTVPDLFSSYGN